MKKAGIAVASVMLAGSIALFAGCGSDGTDLGKVNGNFGEALSEQEVSEALKSVDMESAFGDMSSEDWGFGLNLESVFRAEVSTSVSGFSMNYTMNSTTTGALSLKKSADENEGLLGFTFAGEGDEKATVKLTVSGNGQSQSAECALNGSLHFDENSIYCDVSSTGMLQVFGMQDINRKIKISVDEIVELVMSYLEGDTNPDISDQEVVDWDEDTDEDDVDESGSAESEYYLQLIRNNAKTYIDDSDGFKMKVSLGDIIKSMVEESSVISCSECVLDIYFVIDANGLFQQFSIDVNVALSNSSMNMSLKGGVKITASEKTVTLPEGIADDESYVEISLSEMIPGSSY